MTRTFVGYIGLDDEGRPAVDHDTSNSRVVTVYLNRRDARWVHGTVNLRQVTVTGAWSTAAGPRQRRRRTKP